MDKHSFLATRSAWIVLVLLVSASVLAITEVPTSEAQVSPTLKSATVNNFSTSLRLEPGEQLYIFGYTTGGGLPSTSFNTGQFASVTNAAGYLVASLAVTNNNTNSFSSQSAYPVIGGVAISGFSSYLQSYGSNGAPAATSASVTFSVAQTGSLVVVIALAGDEQCQQISGLPGFTIAASSAGTIGLPPAITIGYAYAPVGFYAVTEATSQCAAGQTPNYAGDLIGAFVFAPISQTTSTCGAPTISLQTPSISGLSVTVNGVTQSGGSSCSISSISWSWGDGQSSTSFFPASHTYSSGGTYSITATTHQSDGQTASASTSVTTTTTTTTSSSGGGGIPEFPYQLLPSALFVFVVVVSYLVIRRGEFGKRSNERVFSVP